MLTRMMCLAIVLLGCTACDLEPKSQADLEPTNQQVKVAPVVKYPNQFEPIPRKGE